MLPVIFSILQTQNEIKFISIVLFCLPATKSKQNYHYYETLYFIILQKTVFHYLKIFFWTISANWIL